MSIVVEHEKRRREILQRVIGVFVDEGFENTTLQKIANHCGITRTTLYIYFKNKKEIFRYSIKSLLAEVNEGIQAICADTSLGSIEKITRVILDIFTQLEENRRLLSVILNYILYISKSNTDPDLRVRRRVLKLRHILTSLLIEGIQSGEIKPIDLKTANNYIYSMVEAAIYRLVILRKETVGDLRTTMVFAVRQFANEA